MLSNREQQHQWADHTTIITSNGTPKTTQTLQGFVGGLPVVTGDDRSPTTRTRFISW
jgi:hypothetical protein